MPLNEQNAQVQRFYQQFPDVDELLDPHASALRPETPGAYASPDTGAATLNSAR